MRYLAIVLILSISGCGTGDDNGIETGDARVTRVVVAEPTLRDIEYVLTALGSVESINDPTLSAETSGQVQRIQVNEGDSVTPGQVLASLDSTLHEIDTAKAEAELRRADVVLDNQLKEVERLQRLAKSQSVSRDKLEDEQAQLEILTAQRDVARKQWEQAVYLESKTQVKAPIKGLVTRRYISPGDYVVDGQPLFDLVSVSRLRARIAFPEQDAAQIDVGKPVRLTTPAAPGETAIGEVTAVNPQIKTHNRAVEVTVEFDNPGRWLPGASVDAELVVARHKQAISVPVLALSNRDDKAVVFILEEDTVRAAAVKTGWRERGWVEILEGLEPGQGVVIEGAAMLTDGSRVTVERRMSGTETPPP
jgi:membrane fusion protein (multidrug efflux system)